MLNQPLRVEDSGALAKMHRLSHKIVTECEVERIAEELASLINCSASSSAIFFVQAEAIYTSEAVIAQRLDGK